MEEGDIIGIFGSIDQFRQQFWAGLGCTKSVCTETAATSLEEKHFTMMRAVMAPIEGFVFTVRKQASRTDPSLKLFRVDCRGKGITDR
jgi:hypothetical protein